MKKDSRWRDMVMGKNQSEAAWELFHENSKVGTFDVTMTEAQARISSRQAGDTLPYTQFPRIALPEDLEPIDVPLSHAIAARSTPAAMTRERLSMPELAALLYCAYGVSRDGEQSGDGRSRRTVPSAGATYPLEIFFHSVAVDELPPGLYHYNPIDNELRRIRAGDQTAQIASALIDKELAVKSSLIVFIAAMFERTISRYGDRGYRLVLLEAGHLAQNLILAATGLGLGCCPIGNYHDRKIDRLLGFDGLLQSTVYMAAVGMAAE
jgi:SagB-type dehydrogenase family enzyme